jgi:pimeloyl-ACP methyl ester carboxylesterase
MAGAKKLFADKKKKKRIIILASVAAVLVTAIGFGIFVSDYYRADRDEIDEYINRYDIVEVYQLGGGLTVFEPAAGSRVGFIFYPGGKVEAYSYAPLMNALAERGITAVLCEMPFNLAVFDINAADRAISSLPEVEEWYIGGHSLGGSMAAIYLASHKEKLSGIVLLGSYSIDNLTDCPTLSVYGSEDGVMNREKYENNRSNLPDDMREVVIEGGNHAYFGMYGEQKGDGRASISPTEQIEITADAICEFVDGED